MRSMFTRLSQRVFSSGKQKALCDTDAKLELRASQSESTEEPPADETHSNSESSGAWSPGSPTEFDAAVQEGPVYEEEASERCEARMEERAGNVDPCREVVVPNAGEDDAHVMSGSPVRRPTPPSQTGDGQAKRRALKRYRQDATGRWVKGRAHEDGGSRGDPLVDPRRLVKAQVFEHLAACAETNH